MILYHGSYLEIQTPDLVHSKAASPTNLQICFRTQKALNEYLHFEGSEQI